MLDVMMSAAAAAMRRAEQIFPSLLHHRSLTTLCFWVLPLELRVVLAFISPKLECGSSHLHMKLHDLRLLPLDVM
jgi:hypothetical protein